MNVESTVMDETQIINLNEQLLNVIQLDNNTELIRFLLQNDNFCLFECIDERLMISLVYRVTQLLKNEQFTNDIGAFLKKEFVLHSHSIPNGFSLPNQLKMEFLKCINKCESLLPFVDQITAVVG